MIKTVFYSVTLFILFVSTTCIHAQQTPIFSDYYYNQVVLNPAHSGYKGDTEVTISNFAYVNQFDGSPRALSGTFSTSLLDNKVGISGGVISDQIGIRSATTIFGSYAYKLIFDHHYNRARWWDYNPNVLSFGLTAGALFLDENLSELNIQEDPNFENDVNITVPTFGVGALFNHNKLSIGFSIQNLFAGNIASDYNVNIQVPYYLYGAYRIYLNKFQEIRLQPSILAKFEKGVPAQFDFNVSVNYKNKVEIGTGYRTKTSFNILAGLYVFKKVRLAYSYTIFNRNPLFTNSSGFMLTYNGSGKF